VDADDEHDEHILKQQRQATRSSIIRERAMYDKQQSSEEEDRCRKKGYKAGGKRKEKGQDGREKRRGLGVRYTRSRRALERDVWSSWRAVETVDGRRQRRRRRGFRRRAEEHWETAEVIRGRCM
jgi:hypothetical protein